MNVDDKCLLCGKNLALLCYNCSNREPKELRSKLEKLERKLMSIYSAKDVRTVNRELSYGEEMDGYKQCAIDLIDAFFPTDVCSECGRPLERGVKKDVRRRRNNKR